VWVGLAALMFWLWMSRATREGASLRTQLVALAVVILIMLPVISMTDDLIAAQNPAETDSCQRKDHVCATAHPETHTIVDLMLPVYAEHTSCTSGFVAQSNLPAPPIMIQAIYSIQSRPPPAA
jgi:hypothetical protein